MLHQDSKSALLLEMSGTRSTSKRSKHIKVQYFIIKDEVNEKENALKYCPMEEIWADVLTKPKQGQLFRDFQSKLMNISVDIPTAHFDTDLPTPSLNKATQEQKSHLTTSVQECVDKLTKHDFSKATHTSSTPVVLQNLAN